MAKTTDMAAEKARKQKIILAVAGVLLVGMAVIQVPKLMKSDSTPAAAPAAETAPAAATTTATPTTAAAVTTTTVAVTGKPAAFVAGVGLPATRVPEPAKSQLASFTLFEAERPVRAAGQRRHRHAGRRGRCCSAAGLRDPCGGSAHGVVGRRQHVGRHCRLGRHGRSRRSTTRRSCSKASRSSCR